MLDGFTNLRVNRHPLSMTIRKGSKTLRIEQLSDGEKCTLAMFGDLARRLSIANPYLDNPLEGYGIVLIDEIELHMHPGWQRKVLPTLSKLFPNIQFIVTTHSPQVLGEVNDKYNIISLETVDGKTTIEYIHRLDAVDSNVILEDLMNVPSRNVETSKYISQIHALIRDNRLDEAQQQTDALDIMANGKCIDVAELNAFIRRRRRGK